MSNEFVGKTVLVTGASRGIGAAAAVDFARRGAGRILIHYGGYPQGAEETRAAVAAAGAEGITLHGDFSTDLGIRAFLTLIEPYKDSVDILINNAGHLVQRAKLTEFTFELYDRVMNVNVKSAWFVAQAVAAGMIARRTGTIVNVSSIAARNGGGPGATIYSAAKAAVACFTKGLAKELAPHNIRVNAISPGTVDNYFHEKYSTREILENVVRMTPQGRLSTNEEMAEVIVFLCSDAARNIIGQTIEINGGMFMI